MKRMPLLLAGLCLLLTPALSARQAGSNGLLEIAAAQGIKTSTGDAPPVFLLTFSREGQRRDTLVLQSGAKFETQAIAAGNRRCVSLFAAIPFNLGDGAVLKISTRDERGMRQAFELTLDPAHVRAHRKWLPIRFDTPSDLPRMSFVFEVSGGSRGDSIADWVGVAPGGDSGCLFSAASAH